MDSQFKSDRVVHLAQVRREQKSSLTVHRRAVFEAILGRNDHPMADQRVGVVARICHPGSVARFDPKTYQHHHLVCLHCERIVDFEDERLNGMAWLDVRTYGFRIDDYHIHFRGICSECRGKRQARADSRAPTRRKAKK